MQHGIAARRQMQMITALDAERDRISERTKYEIGPWSQGHNHVARDHRTIGAADAPSAGGRFERPGIAHQKASALALEKRRIGFRQSTGIGNKSGRRQIDGAGEFSGQVGLARGNGLAIENLAVDAIILRSLKFANCACQRRFASKDFEPAGPSQQFRHFRLGDQGLVLDQAAPDQRQFGHGAVQRPVRRRREKVACQPRQESR